MTKQELAEYLVDLHTLLDAQFKTVTVPSQLIGAEYDRVWTEFKGILAKEELERRKEDETRQRAYTSSGG
jgi:hypothetical protein